MTDRLRELTVALNARRMVAGAERLSREAAIGASKLKPGDLAGMATFADFVTARCATWRTPADILTGAEGWFDVNDVLAWTALANLAGVPHVPAHEIARFSEVEMDILSGAAPPGAPAAMQRAADHLASLPETDQAALASMLALQGELDAPDSLAERLYAALDELPNDMMVRHHRSGSSTLKAFAGAGIMSDGNSADMGRGIEVGPGWVRNGNRRRIDVSDDRFLKSQVDGYVGDAVFVARPWMKASRLLVADDPMRAGTPVAGKGEWPAEWRAFVENGEVVGVSAYYVWAGGREQLDAQMALLVRERAAALVARTKLQKLVPEWMKLEWLRGSPNMQARAISERFTMHDVHCTLDFMETEHGLLFLEGGPAFTPIGGGFPCGFAMSGPHATPRGVAYRIPEALNLTDPKSWGRSMECEGLDEDCWLSWEDTERLAAGYELTTPAPR